jgi:hypothetical protein
MRDAPRFRNTAIGQSQLGVTAKAFRFDALNMTMSDQEDFRQCLGLLQAR